jgi:hypothetical protein
MEAVRRGGLAAAGSDERRGRRARSLDGIAPVSVVPKASDAVVIDGSAFVMHGRMQTFRPIRIELARWPGASTLRMASATDEVPATDGGQDRVPAPASWSFEFHVSLPPRLTPEQHAAWAAEGLRQLRQLLYWRWDPIGVSAAFPRTEDEYDAYASVLISRLRDGASPDDVAAYLHGVERDDMEQCVSSRDELSSFGTHVVEWYQESLSHWADRFV